MKCVPQLFENITGIMEYTPQLLEYYAFNPPTSLMDVIKKRGRGGRKLSVEDNIEIKK